VIREPITLGRYTLLAELASGGMATVYLGRVAGDAGFGRTVAIKRMHPHIARDRALVLRFIDEARMVARVHHPNVVSTLDVVASGDEIFLVLEYIRGEPLSGLLRAAAKAGSCIPVPVGLSVILGVLNGLHAAHEAKDEQETPLQIVHRDVSPQNVLVGADGAARVLDFGIAKAKNRLLGTTGEAKLMGKIPYMAPEQISGVVTRQTDIYAAGVVLWETLTSQRLFTGPSDLELLRSILSGAIAPPSALNPRVPSEVDRIIMKALERDPACRYATAREMAEEIDGCIDVASTMKVAEWLEATAGPALAAKRKLISQVERYIERPAPAPAELPDRTQSTEEVRTMREDFPGPSRAEPTSFGTAPSLLLEAGPPPPSPSYAWALRLAVPVCAVAMMLVAFRAIRTMVEGQATDLVESVIDPLGADQRASPEARDASIDPSTFGAAVDAGPGPIKIPYRDLMKMRAKDGGIPNRGGRNPQ